jgi:hypothetical protein
MLGIKNLIWKTESYSEKKVWPLKNTFPYKKPFAKVTGISDVCT